MMRKCATMPMLFTSLVVSCSVLAGTHEVCAQERPLIFPLPQQLEETGGDFIFDENVTILIPPNTSEKDLSLAHSLVREMSDKYGVALRYASRTDIPKDKKVVVMGTFGNALVKNYCRSNGLTVTAKEPGPEGYLLHSSANVILIAGSDDQGAFFGLQSLRQLIQNGKGKKVPGLKVKDWPRLPFRGIRLYVPGPENIAYFKRFMRDFMALYKFNKVIIEFNCMRLDKHPEVNTGWIEFAKSMQYSRSNSTEGIHGEEKNSSHYDAGDGFILEKDDVKDIVDYARENYLEVIPEIPSLTHGYYLLTRHPELAEYPGDKWPDTYCPSNPKSYELMFDVYDEYIEVIKPKMIHIGHDEWWGAPLDACPLCRGKDYGKLFAQDVRKIHSYLGAKGIKAAMWGDYILESVRNAGPQQRVSSTGRKYQTPGAMTPTVVKTSFPKDILIFNWFWDDEKKEKELSDFGFKQLYGNFEPSISNWDERIKKVDVVGGAPSSWASTNEFNFGKDLMLDYLGCANLLWSSHTLRQIELPQIVSTLIPSIRQSLSAKRIPSADGDVVEPIDFSAYTNASKNSKAYDLNLSAMKSGQVQNGSQVFDLASPSSSDKNIVAVGSTGVGSNPFPQEVNSIPVNEDVSSLIFLHAAALPGGNQKAYFNIPNFFDTSDLLGWYEIVYEDGFKVIVPIQYGVNILEWNPGGEKSLNTNEGSTGSPQNAYCYQADAVHCSADEKKPITFYSFEWVNPRFGKVIKEVNVHGSVNYLAQGTDYGTVVSKPMKSNAVLLAAISKVKKREPFKPE